jgi:hypothetical protein
MGATVIGDLHVRIEGDGDNKRYYLEVADWDMPEFDITPLLVPQEPAQEPVSDEE